MPNTLAKNLNLCFKKIRSPLTSQPSSSSPLTPDDDSRPLTSSTATASSPLFKNYNSLYDNTFDYSTSKSLTHSSLSFDPDPFPESDSEPDFATVFASQRFFFTFPGSSNSIIESTVPSSIATTPESSDTLLPSSSSPNNDANQSSNHGCGDRPSEEHGHPRTVENSVAVPTFSPNPYMDLRTSMQEMVEARHLIDVKANWEYLHELLLCYLALNPKSTHKFIIGAFADLLVSLMAEQGGGNNNDGKIGDVSNSASLAFFFIKFYYHGPKPIGPKDAAAMQSAENKILGETPKGGAAAVMQSAAIANERAGVVSHNQADVAGDQGVAVIKSDADGDVMITEAVAGQIVGQYRQPDVSAVTTPAMLVDPGSITIGEALEAAAISAADKPIDQSDAAAIQAAEMRATGSSEITPGGIASEAQSAATRNARTQRFEDQATLSDVLSDATAMLPKDKAVTREDAERVVAAEVRNNPGMSTTPGGVGAAWLQLLSVIKIQQSRSYHYAIL